MPEMPFNASQLNGRRVFVTGASGFIGSHLAERLVLEGANVTCLVHYNAQSSLGNIDRIPPHIRRELRIEFGNIEDGDYLCRMVKDHEIVFHLAALIGIPFSYVSPRSYVRTNIEGTLNILEAARICGVGRVVHTSTSEVYGSALRIPMDEAHPLQAQSPYSASKIGADKLVESYANSFNLPIVTIRPFNTYGPRQSARAIIPTIIVQALERDTIRLGNLTPKRDLTYVADTVDGFVRAATTKGVEGQTINLGSGTSVSVGELAEKILSATGLKKQIVIDESRVRPETSEVSNLVAENMKARELLGWSPCIKLDQGLLETIDYVRSNIRFYDSKTYCI